MGDYRVYIQDESGELLSTGMLINPDKEELIRVDIKKELTPEQKVLISLKDELKQYTKKLGGFVNMHYVRKELLLNNVDIDKAHIVRLIYLATYIDYNNREENLLCKRGLYNMTVPMDKQDIKYVLKLKDATFYNFMSEIKRLNLLYEHEGKFYLNNDYFSKGEASFENKEYTRIFVHPTRYLYENCKSTKHKHLGYIFQLIPFMNYETNIICSNPSEQDFTRIKKLSLKEVCEILGISTANKQNMYKLKNELSKFKIEKDRQEYSFLSYVTVQGAFGIKDYFVINPNVIWAGKNLEIVKDMLEIMVFDR